MATQSQSQPEKKEGFFSRYLDPIWRLSEMIYGILIVMTFTLAFRSIDANTINAEMASGEAVRRMFLAAMGCTIAWGFIDGVMYIMTSLFERANSQRLVRTIQTAPDKQAAIAAIQDEMDEELSVVDPADRQALYNTLYEGLRDVELKRTGVIRDDVMGAIAVALIAFVAVLPVVVPFLFIPDPVAAIRASNLIAVVMLFLIGYRWAKYVNANPWKIGALLSGVAVVIVMIAIPLGG